MSGLVKRSLSLSGHRTSVALEQEFWDILDTLALDRRQSFAALVASIDHARPPKCALASSLRLTVVQALKDEVAALKAAPDDH